MNLPDLPRRNKKPEADFGSTLHKFLEQNPMFTLSLEIKHTRGKNYISFKQVKEAQITYARRIEGDRGVLIRVQGTDGQPDYIYLRKEPAFIGIRYPKAFVIIRIYDFLKARDNSKKKSLSYEEACKIALKII